MDKEVARTTQLDIAAAIYGGIPSLSNIGFITRPPPIPSAPAKTPEK